MIPAKTRVNLAIENRGAFRDADIDDFRKTLDLDQALDAQPLLVIFAENARGPMIIAQFNSRTILVPWNAAAKSPVQRPRATVQFSPVWTQSEPILDALATPDQLLILEPARLSVLRRTPDAGWKFERAVNLNWPVPMPRDPRGRVTGTPDNLRITTPSGTCTGALNAITCIDAANNWIPARNTERARPNQYVATSPITSNCDVSTLTAMNNVADTDGITGYNIANQPVTNLQAVPGIVRELWPAGPKVTAVIYHPDTRRYELTNLQVACPE